MMWGRYVQTLRTYLCVVLGVDKSGDVLFVSHRICFDGLVCTLNVVKYLNHAAVYTNVMHNHI